MQANTGQLWLLAFRTVVAEIEDSTALLETVPFAMREALQMDNDLLR